MEVQKPYINFMFYSLKMSSFSKESVNKPLIDSIIKKKILIIYGYSLGIFPRIILKPIIYKYINNYYLYVSDGPKFHLLGKTLGFPFDFRISLSEISTLSLEIANRLHAKVFLLGSTVKDTIKYTTFDIQNCTTPGNKILLTSSGKLKPEIIFLGISSHKKEKFIYN